MLNQDDFRDIWLNKLTEQQRKVRAEKAFAVIKKVAEKQLALFAKFEKFGRPDGLRFSYFYQTIESVWENVDFILSLGKGKNKRFAFYPARAIMENAFRLEFFSRQKKEFQEDIAIKECLRICKRNYEHELSDGNVGEAERFKNYYCDFTKLGNFTLIENISERALDPFPSLWELMKNSKINGGTDWYYHYQGLAESTHGKYMHLSMISKTPNEHYRLSLMYALIMCNDLLKNADYQLVGKTREDVIQAIKISESIIKRPVQ